MLLYPIIDGPPIAARYRITTDGRALPLEQISDRDLDRQLLDALHVMFSLAR